MRRASKRLTLALLALVAATAVQAAKDPIIERYQARAMSLTVGGASFVDVAIREWSTAEEHQAIVQAFKEKGNQGVYDFLEKQKEKAFVKLPQSTGYQMGFATQFQADDKRFVLLATNRPLGFREVMRNTNSSDYDISLVLLRLDPETGDGTGTISLGNELRLNPKTGHLEVETYSVDPIRLSTVTQKKIKEKKKKKGS